jgi:hypothetical protein
MLIEPSPPLPHAVPSSGSTFLPLIPPVSPITANVSPLRGKHVAFANADDSASKKKKRSEEDVAPPSPSKISESRSAKRAYQKHLVFDKKTVSPPRVRNRHFTGRSKKMRADHSSDDEGDSDDGGVNDLTSDRSTGNRGSTNIFAQVRDGASIGVFESATDWSRYACPATGGATPQPATLSWVLDPNRMQNGFNV